MMRDDLFRRLPPATALLILSTLLETAQASALPKATTTLPYRILDVVAWPPLPTAPAISPGELHELLRRQDSNTVCGYIGGDPNLPATCSAGSHCVLDREHKAIGCCPNGEPTCSTGIFTGCVDYNSGPQTVVNPYVYTCKGSDVCYKNVFGGGNSQYGCGTASNLATTVQASASGITTAVSLTSVSVSFTESFSTPTAPITIDPSTGTFTPSTTTSQPTSSQDTRTSVTSPSTTSASRTTTGSSSSSTPTTSTTSRSRASSSSPTSTTSKSTTSKTAKSSSSSKTTTTRSSSSSSSSSSSTTSASSSTSTTGTTGTIGTSSPAETTSAAAAPAVNGDNSANVNRTGAIVGGTISGVAVLVAIVAVAIFLWRRKAAANVREGPGANGSTQYISPMTGGQGFQRLHDSNAAYETGLPPGAIAALPPAAAMYGQQQQQQQDQQWQQQPQAAWQTQWQQQQQQQQQQWAQQQQQREMQQQQQYQQWEQQQQQKWNMDANAQLGLTGNSGTVRYVEGDLTAAQVGHGNVAYVESVAGESAANHHGSHGYPVVAAAAIPSAAAAAAATAGGATDANNNGNGRPQSVQQTPPAQGYHYPGQYPAAYAGAPAGASNLDRGVSHGGSSFYSSGVPPPVPPPPAPSSAYGGSSVSRNVSIRGGSGGGSVRSHPTPIASQFTSGAWAVHTRERSLSDSRATTGGDEYSRGYSDGLERIGEDEPLATNMQDMGYSDQGQSSSEQQQQQQQGQTGLGGGLAPNDSVMSRASGSSDASSNGGRPLWHQNRLHSRNQMWM